MTLQLTLEEGHAYAEQMNKGKLDHVILCDDNYPFLSWITNGKSLTPGTRKEWGKNITDAVAGVLKGFECGEDLKPVKGYKGIGKTNWRMDEHAVAIEACVQEEMYEAGDCAPVVDILKARMDIINRSVQRQLDFDLQMAPTGIPNTAHGYYWLINDALGLPGRSHTIGGVNNQDCPWWQSQIKRPGKTWPRFNPQRLEDDWVFYNEDDVTTNPYDVLDSTPWQVFTLEGTLSPYINNMKSCTLGNGRSAIGWMSQDLFEKLRQLALANAGACCVWAKQGDTLVGDAEYVEYRGMKFMVSWALPPGTIVFATNDDLKFRYHPSMWLRARPWVEAERAQRKTMMINAWWGPYLENPMALGLAVNVSHK